MAQLIETIEASTEPLPVPPKCTYPDKLWCSNRALRYGKLACYASQQCSPTTPQQAKILPRVRIHRVWPAEDVERLSENSHLDIKALQWLLEDYSEDEIQDKLEDLTPSPSFPGFSQIPHLQAPEK
jgi:hypothetical protein